MTEPADGVQVFFAPKGDALVTVHGQVTNDLLPVIDRSAFTNLIPNGKDSFVTGDSDQRWQEGYFGTGGITSNGELLGTSVTTQGDDTLGNGPEDTHTISGNLNVGANIFINGTTNLVVPAYVGQGDLIPAKNSTYDIGSTAFRWQDGYFVDYTTLRRHYNTGTWTVNGSGQSNFGDAATDTHTFNGALTLGHLGPISGDLNDADDLTLNGTGIALNGGLSSGGTLTVTNNFTASGNTTWGSQPSNVHTITGNVHFTGPVKTTGDITGYSGGAGTYSANQVYRTVPQNTFYPTNLSPAASSIPCFGFYVKVGTMVDYKFRVIVQGVTNSTSWSGTHVNIDIPLPFPRVMGVPDEDYTTGFAVMRSYWPANGPFGPTGAHVMEMKNTLTPNNREFQSPIISDAGFAAPDANHCRFTGDGLIFIYEDGNTYTEPIDYFEFNGQVNYLTV